MIAKKNILVVGTGTIGEPLIGLLADFRKKLDIGHVIFHKRTPLVDEVAKVNSLIKRGAKLAVNEGLISDFRNLGHDVKYDFQTALKAAHVVIDCTPAGNAHKKEYYMSHPDKVFIAQGSEKGFGLPYAFGINDAALKESNSNFVQVVSCNTHNICSLVKTIAPSDADLVKADFVCIRRANDISQKTSFVPSPEVGKHPDQNFGTHHARDAQDVFATMGNHLNLFSSAMKLNTQYMHIVRFNLRVKGHLDKNDVVSRFRENKFTAITQKTSANRVFSFGRDHGYYGRIFNHTVLSVPSLHTMTYKGDTIVSGFCFTPQDGNSLLSSCSAALWWLCGDAYIEKMMSFDDYLFTSV
jgi:glyceraldehyde-3-phosphate dehydrogenase (NAD(P))